jgi:assimilatory nitrate reductase catalytic subunit
MFTRWSSPENVFQLLKELSRGMPYDFTGIQDYRMIDEKGGIQWPYPLDSSQEKERRLFTDGQFFTPDKKARLLFDTPRPMPEPPDQAYPFLLLTGRGTASQWHTNTRTGKSDVLRKLYPKTCYVEVHPLDAERLGIQRHEIVMVSSRRGKIEAEAFITPTVQAGQLFIPMHYSAVNQLTFPAFDPHSRQPSYKACSVALSTLRNRKPSIAPSAS